MGSVLIFSITYIQFQYDEALLIQSLMSLRGRAKLARSRRHFEKLPERIDADRLRVNSGVLSNISSSRAIRYPDHPNCRPFSTREEFCRFDLLTADFIGSPHMAKPIQM